MYLNSFVQQASKIYNLDTIYKNNRFLYINIYTHIHSAFLKTLAKFKLQMLLIKKQTVHVNLDLRIFPFCDNIGYKNIDCIHKPSKERSKSRIISSHSQIVPVVCTVL